MTNRPKEGYSFLRDDFTSARAETLWKRRFQRGKWSAEVLTRTVLTSSETHFRLHAELDAWEKDDRVFSRNWQYEIPRDHL